MGNLCNGNQGTTQLDTSQLLIPPSVRQTKLPIHHHKNHGPSQKFGVSIKQTPELTQKCQYTLVRLNSTILTPQQQIVQQIDDTNNNNNDNPAIVTTKSITDYYGSNQQPDSTYKQTPYLLNNGNTYIGCWHNGQIHGPGKLYLKDGSYLESYFYKNKPIGKVRYIAANGNYYEGFTQKNMAQGKGRFVNANAKNGSHGSIKKKDSAVIQGIQYDGTFQSNYLQGQGRQIGQCYQFQGVYKSGHKVKGVLKWWNTNDQSGNSKCEYRGQFKNQQFHGYGILFNQTGQYQGMFERGKKKGQGVFTWINGAKFQGLYIDNAKNGQGKMYNPKGQLILEGKWVNNKPPSVSQVGIS